MYQNLVLQKMIAFDKGDARRIQHFLKVCAFASLIGAMERLPAREQEILETAAILHDIGIHPAMEKYGRQNGKLQEQEGPAPARGFSKKRANSRRSTSTASASSSPIIIRTITWKARTGRSCSKRTSSSTPTKTG